MIYFLIVYLSHAILTLLLNIFIIFDHEFVKIAKFTQTTLSLVAIVPDEFVLIKFGVDYYALWMSVKELENASVDQQFNLIDVAL